MRIANGTFLGFIAFASTIHGTGFHVAINGDEWDSRFGERLRLDNTSAGKPLCLNWAAAGSLT